MKLTPLNLIIALFVMLAASGCNSDIFIDDDELPDLCEFTLDGSGDNKNLVISTKGLLHINMYANTELDGEYVYIDKNGHIASPDIAASELRSIDFDNDLRSFGLGIDGDMFYFVNNFNCTDKEFKVTVTLDYDYGRKTVNFIIGPGEPLKLQYRSYDGPMDIVPDYETVYGRMTFNNNSSRPQTIVWHPFGNVKARALIEPADAWAKDMDLRLYLPAYYRGEWLFHEYHAVTKCDSWFEYPCLDTNDIERIEIPANSSVTVNIGIRFSKVEMGGEIGALNPVMDYHLRTTFKFTAYYPVSYEINYQK